MRINNLEQFIQLRRELTQEKEQLSRRLAQINEALGDMPLPSLAPAEGVSKQAPQPSRPAARGGSRRQTGGGGSLREHVVEALKGGALTKEEVLQAVQKRGYKFQTNNPLNSLGVILYGKNPRFKRVDGRFSLEGGASSGAPAQSGGRRQMSAAGRARIAEAQRKRWEASRKGQGGAANGAARKPAAGKRQMSAAGRKAIAEAARRRWAAAKAAGRSAL
jgi:hypothetical protein